jgi:hypothetical protein
MEDGFLASDYCFLLSDFAMRYAFCILNHSYLILFMLKINHLLTGSDKYV